MSFAELLLIAVGLSMDAFAVSVCKGLRMRSINWGHSVVISLFFGGFQALMPLAGWVLGTRFQEYIVRWDHWIAAALLAFIGSRMIKEATSGEGDVCACDTAAPERIDLKELLILAVATSIDALAVGITFAFLSVDVLPAVSTIGVVTFLLSFAGVAVGNRFGVKYKSRAEIAGGAVLILIGVKILLSHLGIIGF